MKIILLVATLFSIQAAFSSEFDRTLELANNGNTVAQSNLGVMYGNGLGVAKNATEAVKWYRKAAEQGDVFAQSNLAFMYANGHGVAENDAVAVNWYRKAAEQGDAGAQSNLGSMYAKGDGVAKDKLSAYAWWSLAKAQGDSSAIKNIETFMPRMTAQQIGDSQALAAKCYSSGYRDCD
jgi:TPR repeat protein